jgi:hypothetical protein
MSGTEPIGSLDFTALMLASEACSAGDCLLFDTSTGYWRVASTANRTSASVGTQAIARSDYGGSEVGKVKYQTAGVVPQSVSGLPALTPSATTKLVRTSSTGTLERIDAYTAGDDVVGFSTWDGRVALMLGLPWSLIVASAAGAASVAAGDGIRVTSIGDAYTVHGVRGTCSLEQFGAVGDGTTDDAVAFELAEAALAAGTYKTLVVGAKTYKRTSGSFTLAAGCTIMGCGPSSVLYTTANAPNIVIGGEQVAIRNLKLLGSSSGSSQDMIKDGTQDGGGNGHSNWSVTDVLLVNAGNCGINYQENPLAPPTSASLYLGPQFTNVRMVSCRIGVYTGNRGEYARFVNCHTELCTDWGWWIAGGNCGLANCTDTFSGNGCYVSNAQQPVGYTAVNSGHSEMVGCAFNHSAGIGFKMSSPYGQKIVGGSIYAAHAGGVTFTTYCRGALFVGVQVATSDITAEDGATARFADCIMYPQDTVPVPTLTFHANSRIEFENCVDVDGNIPPWIQAHQRQTYAFPSDANQTLTAKFCSAQEWLFTGTLSDPRTLTIPFLPDAGFRRYVRNNTNDILRLQFSTGTYASVNSGAAAIIGADDTDCTIVLGGT